MRGAMDEMSGYGSPEWASDLRNWTLYLVEILCGEFIGEQGNGFAITDFCTKIFMRFLRMTCAMRAEQGTRTASDASAQATGARADQVLLDSITDPRILAPVLFLIVCKFQEVQCPVLADLSVLANVPADVLREAELVLLTLLDFDIYIIDGVDGVEAGHFLGDSASSGALGGGVTKQGVQDPSIPSGCPANDLFHFGILSPTSVADMTAAW